MSHNSDPSQHPSTLSQPFQQREDLTWLDFLRAPVGDGPTDRPAPLERQTSADRKRRYAGAEPEGRSYPYPQYASASVPSRRPYQYMGGQPSSVGNTAIDHTTPSPSAPPPSSQTMPPRQHGSDGGVRGAAMGRRSSDQVVRRRESDIVVPPWQPDVEVTRCPVCQSEFSFWYRKHHCRKCGRVVCNACSPHRITIPRQFIVQPPNPYMDEQESVTARTEDEYENLGGGEIVRVCNPCVPDPWTPTAADASTTRPGAMPADPPETFPAALRQDYHQRLREDALRRSQLPPGIPPPPPPFHARHRSQTHQPTPHHSDQNSRDTADFEQLMTTHLAQQLRRHYQPGHPNFTPPPTSANNNPAHPRRHTHSSSLNTSSVYNRNANFHPRHSHNRVHFSPPQPHHRLSTHPSSPSSFPIPVGQASSSNNTMVSFPRLSTSHPVSGVPPPPPPRSSTSTTAPPAPPPPPPPPRREVKEEDECPVCGIELPPGEHLREAHVQECIATRFASAGTSSGTNNSATTMTGEMGSTGGLLEGRSARGGSVGSARGDVRGGRGEGEILGTSGGSMRAGTTGIGGAGSAPTRPRATSYRPRGMAISRATEKDCVSEDGEAVECVICFEEFQPGDELGRMECLCKFHRACIRSWWETKGVGSCPTHQLHE